MEQEIKTRQKLALSVEEACALAGVRRDFLYREINEGRLKTAKIKGRRLIRRQALERWLEALPARWRDEVDRLESPRITLGLPKRYAPLKALDGALDLQWHTDQLHLIGAGGEPDPQRAVWRTAVTTLRRNGFDAFRSRRGGTAATDGTSRKFQVERVVGKYVANPLVRGLTGAGVQVKLMTDIETVGRKSGLTRRVPVSAKFDETGAWIISQHGTRSGWGANIPAGPRGRLRVGDRWRSGIAEFVHGDDVAIRARSFANNAVLGRLVGATFAALATTPVSVRVTFD